MEAYVGGGVVGFVLGVVAVALLVALSRRVHGRGGDRPALLACLLAGVCFFLLELSELLSPPAPGARWRIAAAAMTLVGGYVASRVLVRRTSRP